MVTVALVGTMIGQVVFGYLGDRVGRRRVYGLSLTLMVLSSFGCGFSICTSQSCVLGSLGFFRFLLGLGIGGDYPLSATIMSEFANKTTSGAFIAVVFSMQGFGILASSLVTMVVCSAFYGSYGQNPGDPTPGRHRMESHTDAGGGSGDLHVLLAHENSGNSKVYSSGGAQCAPSSQGHGEGVRYVPDPDTRGSTLTIHRPHPIIPPAFEAVLLPPWPEPAVLRHRLIYHRFIPDKSSVNAFEAAFEVAKLQAIVAACSTIPGYWATVYFIERVGRVKIQMLGFLFMAAVYMALGIPYYTHWNSHTDRGFMFLYGLTLFFANFGPNTTTFIVPAEIFHARFRSTCHGLSGAAGKLGAIIGSVGFVWTSHSREENGYPKATGMTTSLAILGGVCIVGAVITYLFTPETRGRSLEENEKDDVEATETMNVLRCIRSSNSSIQSDSSYGGGVEPRSACWKIQNIHQHLRIP
ncbi:hypothetical protein SAY87_021874 [Trapa incisa]|uniref:Major facilitator superfamily (MFS) profile domain-containing protein n=1 Tax=Trapa incisa TaxID=236973 RepID=A0AAN7PSI2_9MYRT|nr:hypothetical protein SAY87_021874 [Trapa incisa]